MDQSFLAGLGNIYTDEALHLAHLHPCRYQIQVTNSGPMLVGMQFVRCYPKVSSEMAPVLIGFIEAAISKITSRLQRYRGTMHCLWNTYPKNDYWAKITHIALIVRESMEND
jgi:formamidopyrimidine-DNA glycosylase